MEYFDTLSVEVGKDSELLCKEIRSRFGDKEPILSLRSKLYQVALEKVKDSIEREVDWAKNLSARPYKPRFVWQPPLSVCLQLQIFHQIGSRMKSRKEFITGLQPSIHPHKRRTMQPVA